MADALLDIKHWGNSLGLRVPAKIARAVGLRAEQRVHMYAENGRVVIEPVQDALPSLAERLSRFDPERHGGEALLTAKNLGAERW